MLTLYQETATKQHYASNRESICAYRKDKYILSEPKPVTRKVCLIDLENNLLGNAKVKSNLTKAFRGVPRNL